jgi:methionyl-tRNA formyltransferase
MHSIAFFGSSEYSVIILEKLLTLPDFTISAVITKVDKPAGRDQIITPNPVAAFATQHNLLLLQTEVFDENFKLKIKNCHADLALCVAYGPPYFDQEMLDIINIINIHPSPLPRYRGATPGPWQIINGEAESAVTFFQIDILPDHGPIISQIPFDIAQNETSSTFYQKAFNLAAQNLDSVLKNYLKNPQNIQEQNHLEKSYYPKLTKESGKIDWSWDDSKIYRFINAMSPWPVAWANISSKDGQLLKMKILSASLKSEKLEIEKVHIEGKKPTIWSEISAHYSLIK